MSQAPLGVAATRLRALSTTATCTVPRCHSRPTRALACAQGSAAVGPRDAGPVCSSVRVDQLAACRSVGVREQLRQRHVHEIGVTVVSLTVRKGLLTLRLRYGYRLWNCAPQSADQVGLRAGVVAVKTGPWLHGPHLNTS